MQTVKDILAVKGTEIVSVRPEAVIHQALEVMAEKDVGAALVIDASGAVQGIFSERDFARKIIFKGRSCDDSLVKDIMTAKVTYVRPETTIRECMNLMTEQRIRHLPVLEGGKPAGLVSIGDVVKALLKEQEKLISEQAFEIGQRDRLAGGAV